MAGWGLSFYKHRTIHRRLKKLDFLKSGQLITGPTKALLGVGNNQKELSFSDHTHSLPNLDGVLPATNGGTGYTSLNSLKAALNISASIQVIILTQGSTITKNHYYGGILSQSRKVDNTSTAQAIVCDSSAGTYVLELHASSRQWTTLEVTGGGPYTISLSTSGGGNALVFVSD